MAEAAPAPTYKLVILDTTDSFEQRIHIVTGVAVSMRDAHIIGIATSVANYPPAYVQSILVGKTLGARIRDILQVVVEEQASIVAPLNIHWEESGRAGSRYHSFNRRYEAAYNTLTALVRRRAAVFGGMLPESACGIIDDMTMVSDVELIEAYNALRRQCCGDYLAICTVCNGKEPLCV